MASTTGDFGGPNGPKQCTAISKRSGKQCKGPAVIGSRTQKCRMHGGRPLVGTANPNFGSGRYSRYLPQRIQELYDEAVSNPDLLDMSDHLALLETRIREVIQELSEENVVPRWSAVKEIWGEVRAAVQSGDTDKCNDAIGRMDELIDSGMGFDSAWGQVAGLIDQVRKVADTEVKRRKDLGLMIPVERVQTLAAALALAVKRHVSDPLTLKKIYAEMEQLKNGTQAPAEGTRSRLPNDAPMPKSRRIEQAIDVEPIEVD